MKARTEIMTPNKEDYLKLIYELGGFTQKISNKAIVSGLHVSAASVSEMVSNLKRRNLSSISPIKACNLPI